MLFMILDSCMRMHRRGAGHEGEVMCVHVHASALSSVASQWQTETFQMSSKRNKKRTCEEINSEATSQAKRSGVTHRRVVVEHVAVEVLVRAHDHPACMRMHEEREKGEGNEAVKGEQENKTQVNAGRASHKQGNAVATPTPPLAKRSARSGCNWTAHSSPSPQTYNRRENSHGRRRNRG